MSLQQTIIAVQKKLTLTPDGKAGPATWSAIHLAVIGTKPPAAAGLDTLVRAVQTKLGVFVDGQAGPETWGKIHLAIVGKKPPGTTASSSATLPVGTGKKADSRSEGNIATLHPRVQPYARALIEKAAGQGIIIKVISAMRTYAEQDALYAKGRTVAPIGKKYIVTNARGGYSNHNFGVAFDIGIFKGSTDPEKALTYVPESPVYKAIGALGTDLGLEWGGNWKTIVDQPHFQLRPVWADAMTESAMLAELRQRKASGLDYYA